MGSLAARARSAVGDKLNRRIKQRGFGRGRGGGGLPLGTCFTCCSIATRFGFRRWTCLDVRSRFVKETRSRFIDTSTRCTISCKRSANAAGNIAPLAARADLKAATPSLSRARCITNSARSLSRWALGVYGFNSRSVTPAMPMWFSSSTQTCGWRAGGGGRV